MPLLGDRRVAWISLARNRRARFVKKNVYSLSPVRGIMKRWQVLVKSEREAITEYTHDSFQEHFRIEAPA